MKLVRIEKITKVGGRVTWRVNVWLRVSRDNWVKVARFLVSNPRENQRDATNRRQLVEESAARRYPITYGDEELQRARDRILDARERLA